MELQLLVVLVRETHMVFPEDGDVAVHIEKGVAE